MTNQEELMYLTNLVLEASKWRISEGDETDTIRLEVQDRIRRLNGIDTVDENGYRQSEPIQQPSTPMSCKTAWERARRRVRIGTRYAWVLKEHTEQVPREDSPNRTRWAVKAEFANLYNEKEAK